MAKETAQVEEVKNCPACKKHLKRAKRYYRNGQYFCNKACWTKVKTELQEEAAAAAATAAEAAAAVAKAAKAPAEPPAQETKEEPKES